MYIRGICIFIIIYIFELLRYYIYIFFIEVDHRLHSTYAFICIYLNVYIIPESRIQPLKNILASILTVTAQNVDSQSICFEQVFIVGQA